MKRLAICTMLLLLATGFTTAGTWTTIPIIPSGIDGSNIVGGNQLYNLTTGGFTTLNYPGAMQTEARGIGSNSIVGGYEDSSGVGHGFLYTIPEPASALLLLVGAGMLKWHNRKRQVT